MINETKQLSVLHDLSKAIVGASNMEDVLERILNKTVKILNVTKASIMKFSPKEGLLRIVAAKGLPLDVISSARIKVGEGISGKVFKSAKPLLVKDIRTSSFKANKRYSSKSLMSAPVTCFPMNVSGKSIGVINVTDRKNKKPFTPLDLKLLTTIANQTAVYLHLCDLVDEARRTEHIKRELDMAREIQQKLLPQKMPYLKGYDIAGRCLTAERVGGDYFDVIHGGARPPAVVVADVAGHSVSAAIMMSAFRSAVRSESAVSYLSPAIISEYLNTLLYPDLSSAEQFISMIYAQLMQGSLRYTSAGHWPPIVLHNGGFVETVSEDGLLGVSPHAEFCEKRVPLSKKDLIVLFTDGLIEIKNKKRAKYGVKRLKKFIKRNAKRNAQAILDGLCADFARFSQGLPFSDDVTVVIIKVK